MNIIIASEVMRDLETFANQIGRIEFSGIGFCTREGDCLSVYDAVILDVGTSVETNISPDQLLELGKREDAQNGRVWIHLHPVGDGIPGPHNWSGTDERTIQTCPLGGIPEIVKWSASIVRTPYGWVGRVDNHITKNTAHVEVLGQSDTGIFDRAQELLLRHLERESAWSRTDFESLYLGEFVFEDEPRRRRSRPAKHLRRRR